MYNDVLPDGGWVVGIECFALCKLNFLPLDFGYAVGLQPGLTVVPDDIVVDLPLHQVLVTGGVEYPEFQATVGTQSDEC
jgi:hypothetical protein